MATFLPWSKPAQPWEQHAEKLRRLPPGGTFANRKFDPHLLAPLVGLRVLECRFLGLTEEETRYMLKVGIDQWSGGVFVQTLPNGLKLCMLNPHHSPRRNNITLMEEICHCYFGHQPTKLLPAGNSRIRDFQKAVEAEAYGVGAAVLLPWRLIFPLLNDAWTSQELADEFDVTADLVMYRIKICGAFPLYKARQRSRARPPLPSVPLRVDANIVGREIAQN
jgi:Zn-dependent peptidase ImmA (M78 family)